MFSFGRSEKPEEKILSPTRTTVRKNETHRKCDSCKKVKDIEEFGKLGETKRKRKCAQCCLSNDVPYLVQDGIMVKREEFSKELNEMMVKHTIEITNLFDKYLLQK